MPVKKTSWRYSIISSYTYQQPWLGNFKVVLKIVLKYEVKQVPLKSFLVIYLVNSILLATPT